MYTCMYITCIFTYVSVVDVHIHIHTYINTHMQMREADSTFRIASSCSLPIWLVDMWQEQLCNPSRSHGGLPLLGVSMCMCVCTHVCMYVWVWFRKCSCSSTGCVWVCACTHSCSEVRQGAKTFNKIYVAHTYTFIQTYMYTCIRRGTKAF